MYRSKRINPGLWIIENEVVRCFLLEGEDEAVLVDSGLPGGDLKGFLSEITSLPVRRVIHTHADGDHIGCSGQFDEAWLHPAEFDRYRANGGDMTKAHPLWEGDEIVVGERTLTVVLLPGHTPGSIAFLDKKNRVLFGGDVVQDSPIYMFGPGRNMPAFVHAVDKLIALAGQFDLIYAAHGTLSLTPDVLPVLRQGALDVMAGAVPDGPPYREGLPCRQFDCGQVKFLYNAEK